MMQNITLDKLERELKFFNKMYDLIRIVDPVEKKVLEWKDNGLQVNLAGQSCYRYWQEGKICNNCISIRANRENNSFMKLEISPDLVMLVTAIPIVTEEGSLVLELLRNATDTMMISRGDVGEGHKMINMVDKMNDMIIKDQLTETFNRRFIDERLPVDIIKSRLEETPLSLIFIDIDDFKSINDVFGHQAGDLVIKEIARILKESIRGEMDWVARFGGDEFVIVLANTCERRAAIVARRIQGIINNIDISVGHEKLSASISYGIHTMDSEELTPDELIYLADKNMYEDKKEKRSI